MALVAVLVWGGSVAVTYAPVTYAQAKDDAGARSDADVQGPADPVEGSIDPGWLPALSAAVPGAVVRGAGHLVAGDRETAKRLLALEGIGLAAVLVGWGTLYGTGASRKVSGPASALLIAGGGVLLQSWLADIWGAATGGRGVGAPRDELPDVELRAGYRYLHDPSFDYGHFLGAAADFRPGRFRISPEAWAAVDDSNQRARLEVGYGFLGRTSTAGSFLGGSVALDYHNFGGAGFAVLSLEAALSGRLDLAALSSSTRGAFAELSLGWAVQLFDYDAPDRNLGADVFQMLLSRAAFGVYLGRVGPRRGEISIYYDHRRDGWVGGLGTDNRYAGFAGRFGLEGHYYFSDAWGATVEVAVGSAVLVGGGLRHRWGGE